MADVPQHSQQALCPSELVTIGLLYAIKGVSCRAFYHWLSANYRDIFPRMPERTRLFRRLSAHQDWTERLLTEPSTLGVIDTYGIELIHPIREGRSPTQIGKKGLANHRWPTTDGQPQMASRWQALPCTVNHLGFITAWECDSAKVPDSRFRDVIERFNGKMVVLGDFGFHSAKGDPANLKLCRRGEWNKRMKVEIVLSMLTVVCHIKHMRHRVWAYFKTRLAYLMIAFNILVQWDGLDLMNRAKFTSPSLNSLFETSTISYCLPSQLGAPAGLASEAARILPIALESDKWLEARLYLHQDGNLEFVHDEPVGYQDVDAYKRED